LLLLLKQFITLESQRQVPTIGSLAALLRTTLLASCIDTALFFGSPRLASKEKPDALNCHFLSDRLLLQVLSSFACLQLFYHLLSTNCSILIFLPPALLPSAERRSLNMHVIASEPSSLQQK